MGFDDWDDDDSRPRRRRRRRDDDDLGLRRESQPPRSGAVSAAGIVTIIQSVMFLLCGGSFGICGLFCTAAGAGARQQGGFLPPEMFERAGGILLGWAFLHLLVGVGLLMGGIITLQRRNWGRVLTLVCAAIVALMGLTQLVLAILTAADQAGGFIGNANPDDRFGQAIVGMIGSAIYLTYAVFVYIVLLNSHNREEFE